MSQIEYSQTLGQQEEMENLLTKEAFVAWLDKRSVRLSSLTGGFAYLEEQKYFREYGLPLTSEIKGL